MGAAMRERGMPKTEGKSIKFICYCLHLCLHTDLDIKLIHLDPTCNKYCDLIG